MIHRQQRTVFIDAARGISIICIILGHLDIFVINRVVFTFHVPIFFLIAGFFFKGSEEFRILIKKRINTLIMPYVATCIAIAASSLIINQFLTGGEGDKAILAKWVKASLYGAGTTMDNPSGIPFIGAIWFLLAMFWATIALYFVVKLRWEIASAMVLLLLIISCKTAQYYWLPLSIQAAGPGLLYMYIGYWAKKTNIINIEITKKRIAVIVSFALWISFIVQFTFFRMVCCRFDHWYDLIRSLAGCITILAISYIINIYLPNFSSKLAHIGRYSIIILCLHLVELNTFPYSVILENLGVVNNSVVYKGIIVLFKIAFCIVGMNIIIRTKHVKKAFGL